MNWHLAAFNVAVAVAPTDHAEMAEFMGALDEINALADRSPGFVWRFQTADGHATDVRAFDDPDLLLNLSVWSDVEALWKYTYRTDHTPYLRRRREWFRPAADLPVLVLWWVAAGHEPSVEEAKAKLLELRDCGSSPSAFTFRERFGPPGSDPAFSPLKAWPPTPDD